MVTNIFVNLAIKDLQKSINFFAKLGFVFNKQFTDDKAACLVIGPNIYAMLLLEPFFQTFTKKKITDTSNSVEALLALSVESRKEVDEMMRKALEAGATEPREPQDYEFMFSRSFEDPDGHTWEVFWMDPNHIQKS